MIRIGIVITVFLMLRTFSPEIYAQDERTINGIVTTFKTIPLNNVKVTAEKSGETVFTSTDGNFAIKTAEKDQITVSATGFYNKKVKSGDDKILKIDMVFINKEANIQKAVREGHIPEDVLRKALNGEIPVEEKDYSLYKTIFDLISNEIYNVRVKGTSVVNLKVRSFDASPQVLYVVDNKITSDISYISPQYVRSIEFIDDVRATEYGSKGANGVLKIILK